MRIATIALAALTLVLPVAASATVYNETLTGTLSKGSTSTGSTGNAITANYFLTLDGFTTITVAQGDQIVLNVTFDGPLTVQKSTATNYGQAIELFYNPGAPFATTTSSGTLDFTGLTGLATNPVIAGCGNCLGNIFFTSTNAAYSFTGFTSTLNADTLASPIALTDIVIGTFVGVRNVTVPVPEPAALALLGLGAAALATARRRR